MLRWLGRPRTVISALLGTCLLLGPAPAAHAASSRAPAATEPCPDGGDGCVDVDIANLRSRLTTLGAACEHHATFALAYLRTTQAYRFARDQPGFFTDRAWVNREGALFASFYYRAADDWAAGRRSAAPAAWRVAFDNGAGRRLSGVGDVLLGMNAHINRDLPYVLAQVGLTRPDGTSRKPDHDRVNVVLAGVLGPLLAEEAARFDQASFGVAVSPQLMLDVLAQWRELAWRNAERLVSAPSPAARALVAADIDAAAATQAAAWSALTAYLPPFTTTRPRDAYCAAHQADPPPQAYSFGLPTPY